MADNHHSDDDGGGGGHFDDNDDSDGGGGVSNDGGDIGAGTVSLSDVEESRCPRRESDQVSGLFFLPLLSLLSIIWVRIYIRTTKQFFRLGSNL
jgi:hypothetical protein